ncbi:hypothetical protein F511_27495 [Dorcoceras hygrometricum]|uniref:Retrotransposon gag domain-containing protein n=1 Tax=Dorcoceras hygrometricum TaxID=472368 RepID=A0A2Z7CQR7_9LAMI|nr:hypothetical protein F511_27495 [Dorcoceras hygrometricum]
MRRSEIPAFDGTDPVGWWGKAEQYFEIHDTLTYHHLRITHIRMEGPAAHWFQWMKLKTPDWNWDRGVKELIHRYSDRKAANPYESLASFETGGAHQPRHGFSTLHGRRIVTVDKNR